MGVALLTRTTRGLNLTEAGTAYLARIDPILAALDDADQALRGTGELRGTLRVALSIGFGIRYVIPRLPGFMQRHPPLHIDLLMSDQREGLVADSVDVALRWEGLTDSSARPVDWEPHLACSPPRRPT